MKKEISTHAKCAKEMRKELNEAYPLVKFSIRSSSFAGGTSVDISWEGGPEIKEIYKIVDKYRYGVFDLWTDCYEFNNTKKDIPQVKYVLCQREV